MPFKFIIRHRNITNYDAAYRLHLNEKGIVLNADASIPDVFNLADRSHACTKRIRGGLRQCPLVGFTLNRRKRIPL